MGVFLSLGKSMRNQKAPKKESVGVDVGLEHFAILSNGQLIENPRFFKKSEKMLAKAQRK